MRRRVLFAAATALLSFAVVELAAWTFFRWAGARFAYADPLPYTLAPDRIRGLERRFDAELGWTSRFDTPYGERPRPRVHGTPWVAAFGDSHTFCDEVDHHETWETYLADAAQRDVLNFGVGGHAPDQALLVFRRKLAAPAPLVVLGLGFENINRIVNRYRPFYAPQTGIPLPKPRFVLRAGRLELLPNPVADASQLGKLSDPAFVHAMGADDFWYARSDLPRGGFPWSRLLFHRSIWTQALEHRVGSNDNQARPLANLWRNGEARALYLALVDAFAQEATAAGRRPAFLLQPGRVMLEAWRGGRGIPGHRPVLEHCAARGYACFDGIEALGRSETAVDALSAPGGHLSATGNRELARALLPFLRGLER